MRSSSFYRNCAIIWGLCIMTISLTACALFSPPAMKTQVTFNSEDGLTFINERDCKLVVERVVSDPDAVASAIGDGKIDISQFKRFESDCRQNAEFIELQKMVFQMQIKEFTAIREQLINLGAKAAPVPVGG